MHCIQMIHSRNNLNMGEIRKKIYNKSNIRKVKAVSTIFCQRNSLFLDLDVRYVDNFVGLSHYDDLKLYRFVKTFRSFFMWCCIGNKVCYESRFLV